MPPRGSAHQTADESRSGPAQQTRACKHGLLAAEAGAVHGRRGQVLLVTVNEQTMVPFVSTQLQNLDLAMSLARRGNLPGAEALVGQNFERLFASGQFKEAAEAAAESPQVSCTCSSTTSRRWALGNCARRAGASGLLLLPQQRDSWQQSTLLMHG